jgi:hypothetical protein
LAMSTRGLLFSPSFRFPTFSAIAVVRTPLLARICVGYWIVIMFGRLNRWME